jgi:hypothetical protein
MNPIDPPGAPLPDAYTSGVRAIYEYQANHRGEGFDAIWKEVDGETVLAHEGVVFIPERGGEMYMPEAGTSTKSGCLILMGALVAIAFIVAQIIPDEWASGFFALGWKVWLGVGAFVIGFVAFGLVRADRERKENVKQGIWAYGVFLFPDALIIRTDVKNYVYPKKDIIRFDYRRRRKQQNNSYETCAVRLDEYGTEIFDRVTFLRDTTKLLDEWLRRPSDA